MTELGWISIFVLALLGYAYTLLNRAWYVDVFKLTPLIKDAHRPDVFELMSEQDHQNLHFVAGKYIFTVSLCVYATLLGLIFSGLFIVLAYNGIKSIPLMILMTVPFTFLCANYNLNSAMLTWIGTCENRLLAGILPRKIAQPPE